MNKKILVAGAGHGGIIAAYHLAKNGYDVTVFEKKKRVSDLGYDWEDAFEIETFEIADIPVYPYGIKDCLDMQFHGPDESRAIIHHRTDKQNVRMDRRELYRHIIKVAKAAGVKFRFGVAVNGPIMLGSRVAGLHTSKGDFYCDLVIDSAGVDSPVRSNLPDYLGIKNHIDYPDVLTAYRAYFDKTLDVEDSYHVYFLEEGNRGLNWVVTEGDTVDVLLGRLSGFYQGEIEEYTDKLREIQPQLGYKMKQGGLICRIPVRQSLGVLVADGYAVLGDAACMTVPLLGSGIQLSFSAGVLLAKAVMDDKNGFYNARTLYSYQKEYFEKYAGSNATVAILKAMLTKLTFEEVEYFMSGEIISTDDLIFKNSEPTIKEFLEKYSIGDIVRRVRKVKDNSDFVDKILEVVKRVSLYKAMAATMPDRYDYEDVIRWSERYEQFFEKLNQ